MTQACYCSSGRLFSDCCQPFLTNTDIPATPEALMRSRYSAFCSKNLPYLLQTRLPEKRYLDNPTDLEKTFDQTQWLKLDVLNSSAVDDRGTVEFIAFYKDATGIGQIHERSDFLRRDGHWYYADGVHLPAKKLQRNDPCCCGSGKKFKKCCGA